MTVPPSVVRRVAIPVVAYALLEWVFAYVTIAEGLVTPRGAPNAGVVAIGCAYVALRVVVRVVVPGLVAYALADLAARRVLGPPAPRRHDLPRGTGPGAS